MHRTKLNDSMRSNNNSCMNNNNNNINNTNLSANVKQIKIGNYVLGTTIGKGNSAVVKLATNVITKQKVAVKMFDKSGLDNDKQLRLRREIDSMKRLKHKNIIRLYEIMETPKLICLVTEYAVNGELYDYIIRKKRLSEREARYIFKQIVDAIHYSHSNRIVHRDVKVENLLLDSNWQVKLADFGFSSTFKNGELLDVFCGSPPYCAPELYLAKLYDGPKVDIWSLGVVLYVLVCGYLPFEAHVFNVLRTQVINGTYKVPFFLSQDCNSLIGGMLNVDPSKRFSINDIINHKWLKFDNDIDLLSRSNNFGLISDDVNLIESLGKYESTKPFQPDPAVLDELEKYNLNIQDILKSVTNNEFDSNAGLYYLTEAKLHSQSLSQTSSCLQSPFSSDPHQPQAFKYNKQARNSACFQSSFYKEQSTYNGALLSSNNNNNNDFENHNQSLLNKNESHKWTNLVDFVDKNHNQPDPFHKTNLFNEALSKLNQSSNNTMLESSQQVERVVCDENDEEEEDDDEMPIEELGREYLFRYNGIRRHTIGTNAEDNRMSSTKNIMKSTECLLMLNENDSSCSSQLLQSDNQNSDDLETSTSRQTLYLFNLLSNDMNSINLLENNNSNGNSKTSSNEAQNFSRLLASLAQTSNESAKNEYQKPSSVQFPASNNLSLPSGGVPSIKKVQYADESHADSHHRGSHHAHHHHSSSGHHHSHHNHHYSSAGSHHHHIQHHHNLKSQRTRNRMNGAHHNSSHIGQLLSLPINNGRRASDGGSNISLFNQFYSLKSGFNLASRRNNANCDSIRSSYTNEDSLNRSPNANSYNHDDESNQIELNGLNIMSDEKDNADDEIDNDVSYPPTSKIFQSRGSITSGIPIFSVTSVQGNTNPGLGGSQSSEDEEPLNPYNGPNSMKFQRRSSKSRHEPYLDSSAGPASSNYAHISNQSSPPYRSRQRESFSGGGTSNERYSNRSHRGSEPNPLELIFANRSHLERIYNQSINKSNAMSLTKEFKLLKQQQQQQQESLQNNVDLGPSESLILSSQLQSLSTLANDLNGQAYAGSKDTGFMLPSDEIAKPASPNVSNLASYDQDPKDLSSNVNDEVSDDPNELKLLQSNMNELNMNQNSLQMIQEEQNEITMLSSESSSISSSASTTPRMNRSSLIINRRSSFGNSLEYDNGKNKFSLQAAVNQPTKVDYYNNSIYTQLAQSGQHQYFNNFNFAFPNSTKLVNENGLLGHVNPLCSGSLLANGNDLSRINENEVSTALYNSLTKSNSHGQSVNKNQNEIVNLSEAIIE